MTTAEKPLPSSLGAPRIARRLLRETLPVWDLDRLGDAAAPLTSELVNNGVLHVTGSSTSRIVRRTGSIRIEVDDSSSSPPILEHPDDSAELGRGIFLVPTMADDWGYELHDGGKTVWFELDVSVPLGQVHRNRSS